MCFAISDYTTTIYQMPSYFILICTGRLPRRTGWRTARWTARWSARERPDGRLENGPTYGRRTKSSTRDAHFSRLVCISNVQSLMFCSIMQMRIPEIPSTLISYFISSRIYCKWGLDAFYLKKLRGLDFTLTSWVLILFKENDFRGNKNLKWYSLMNLLWLMNLYSLWEKLIKGRKVSL